MDTMRGHIVAVTDRPIGDTLDGDHAAGVTQLVVNDASRFSELGGDLQAGDQVLGYSKYDDDTSTISLIEPTTGALSDGDSVAPWPVQRAKLATVVLDGGGEGIDVTIPHDKVDKVAEGVRAPADQESVEFRFDGEAFVLVDIVGRTPVTDGSYIDPDSTIPPEALTDGQPPAASPAAIVQGGINNLFVRWSAAQNQSPVSYEVHVAPNPAAGADFLCNSVTLQDITTGTMLAFPNGLKDGAPLVADGTVTYFARVVAFDADGAAAPGPAGSDVVRRVQTSDVTPGAITADQISDFTIPVKKLRSLKHEIY